MPPVIFFMQRFLLTRFSRAILQPSACGSFPGGSADLVAARSRARSRAPRQPLVIENVPRGEHGVDLVARRPTLYDRPPPARFRSTRASTRDAV